MNQLTRKPMKYIVLVGDGMADLPLRALGNRTPLEAAKKSNLDFFAASGIFGLVRTIPRGMAAGTDVASLSVLGYDPLEYYSGRGPLEALNRGIRLRENDIVFRCNIIREEGGDLADYSAGHIPTKEAGKIIGLLNEKLGSPSIEFHAGVSYRHLLVIKCGSRAEKLRLINTKCLPPHDVMGRPLKAVLPRGEGAAELKKLMSASNSLLDGNRFWGKANMVWLWGQGEKPDMPSFRKTYGLKGAVISAVDIVKGIGKAIGMEVIKVPGATGYYDTNYEGKAAYAIKALKKNDLVFVHVEAPDEAGHNGDVKAKVRAIEDIDRRVIENLLKGLGRMGSYKILALSDHPTPVSLRTHTPDPVPFAIYKRGDTLRSNCGFNERSAKKSGLIIKTGYRLMEFFLKA